METHPKTSGCPEFETQDEIRHVGPAKRKTQASFSRNCLKFAFAQQVVGFVSNCRGRRLARGPTRQCFSRPTALGREKMMMVFLRVHRNQGAFFSSFLFLSAIVGGIIVLVWATTQSDATDSAGIANDESFPTGTTGFAARGEMFSDLPPASRRRLAEGSMRLIPDADDISTTPTFRLALLRPFAPHDAADLVESFVQWNKFLPCDADAWIRPGSTNDTLRYDADLILSISQTFSSHLPVKEMIDRLVSDDIGQQFLDNSSWSNCFGAIHMIEADISPNFDRYGVSSSDQSDPLW